ncbi:4-coumarate-CoA ligase 2 [Cordyceps fumosorosea ARSEF 2679]|uniref:4-coumarate-CoA ligase 2 n=1 Tax=Cordyceps fumosorosea (strain ARSEF 2679) TaxID=1081104 RepID=A0A168E4B4_CORFA|nr:4-coumarate-CoA ligase 2 [Cordyceps fumosorosea ARSEF 2679]OAA73358.1 4-coumarate-CoA ligase 2 [Cordyceps fumosorosea ARSEF 2679]
MVFKSKQADISYPKDQTIWQWLFESGPALEASASPSLPLAPPAGFTDVTTRRHLTFHQVRRYATHLSSALVRSCGLHPGDVTVVFSKNSLYFPVAALAAVRAGGIACGASPEYTADELAHTLRLSRARFLLAGPEVVGTALAAAAACGLARERVFLIDGQRSDVQSVDELIVQGSKLSSQVPAWKLPPGKTNGEICAYFGFSSGTTGLPKAVMISHANVIAQCLQMQAVTPPDHDKFLAALPFYHITGLIHQFHLPILLNANVYVVPKFTLDVALGTVVEYKIREVLFVPPIIIRLVREPELVGKYDLSHVRRFSSGAAPLSQEILTALEAKFPGTGFKQAYGMTESCSVLTTHPVTKYDYKYAFKVGQLVGSTELRIVDPNTRQDCGIDTPGELWARGPQVTMGYLDNPKATAETFDAEGYLHTGDIGSIDAEGFVSITDRIKDMVKVKGIGVAPAELEDLLLGHPFVKDTAVCGIADDRAGERLKAYVVLQDNAPSSEEAGKALIDFVRSNKAKHKWIVEVEVVSVIPKSPAGKILRRKLRDRSAVESIAVVRETGPPAKL